MNSYSLGALSFLAGVGLTVLVLGPTVRRTPSQTARIEQLEQQYKVALEVHPPSARGREEALRDEELLSKYQAHIEELDTALNSCRAKAASRGEE